jgi:hypothetical protein
MTTSGPLVSGSTVKARSRSASTDYKTKVLKNWTPESDTLKDEVGKHMSWTDLSNKAFPYEHGRPMPMALARKAINYITAIVKQYPFQLRYTMALPLWARFCEAWCDTGDEQKALLAI